MSDRDLVVEIGAGTGSLTEPLVQRAGHVIAVEIDPACVAYLHERFAADRRVDIVEGSALRAPFPTEQFRVVGNLPFGSGTRILRRLLDDPRRPLHRVDVLLQYEAARKRAQVAPSTLATLRWQPWWTFSLTRHLSRHAFVPPPSVDAGLLTIERRSAALLRSRDRAAYVALLTRAFARTGPMSRAVGMRPNAWRAFVQDRGLAPDAGAASLSVFDWVALFERVRQGP